MAYESEFHLSEKGGRGYRHPKYQAEPADGWRVVRAGARRVAVHSRSGDGHCALHPGFVFIPSLQDRVNDDLLLGAQWVTISTHRRASSGTFRASDMVQLRATFQRN